MTKTAPFPAKLKTISRTSKPATLWIAQNL